MRPVSTVRVGVQVGEQYPARPQGGTWTLHGRDTARCELSQKCVPSSRKSCVDAQCYHPVGDLWTCSGCTANG